MYACEYNSLEVVKLLLEKYPDIINQKNKYGWTGFMYACLCIGLKVVELLLEKYPDITNQKSNNG